MSTIIITIFIFILVGTLGVDTVHAYKNFNSSKSNTHCCGTVISRDSIEKLDAQIGSIIRAHGITKEEDVDKVINAIARSIVIGDLKIMLWQIGLEQDGILAVLSKVNELEAGLKELYQAYTSKINQDIGDVLLRHGVGGKEINRVTGAVAAGMNETDLVVLLTGVGVGEEGIGATFSKLKEFNVLFGFHEHEVESTIGGSFFPSPNTEVTTRPVTELIKASPLNAGDVSLQAAEGTIKEILPSERKELEPTATSEQRTNEVVQRNEVDLEFLKERMAPVSIQAVEVRGWDARKKEEFLQTVKTHAEIQSEQDLQNFAKGILLNDENITELEIVHKGLKFQSLKIGYRTPAKFLGVLKISLKTRVEIDIQGKVKVKFPWFHFLFSKPLSVLDIEKAAQNVVGGETQASKALEILSNVLKT